MCRVRWLIGYGEEREASHPRAVAALAKLADKTCIYQDDQGRMILRDAPA